MFRPAGRLANVTFSSVRELGNNWNRSGLKHDIVRLSPYNQLGGDGTCDGAGRQSSVNLNYIRDGQMRRQREPFLLASSSKPNNNMLSSSCTITVNNIQELLLHLTVILLSSSNPSRLSTSLKMDQFSSSLLAGQDLSLSRALLHPKDFWVPLLGILLE